MFNPHEEAACRRLVELALEEDLGTTGDVTSLATIPAPLKGRAAFVARRPGVLAGMPAAAMVFATLDAAVRFDVMCGEGQAVAAGQVLAHVHGAMRSILAGERTALNILQYLCGIATQTRRYVDAVAGLRAQILDTRKTLPGWRLLAKYAVRCGGGHNHRMGLSDGILIKDNHLAALHGSANPVAEAVSRARAAAPAGMPVEIEVDTLEQLDAALGVRPDIVLLDNMPPNVMREAVRRRGASGPGVLLEASGGVHLQTVRAIAETGVDRISVGALTHSVEALDIGLDYDTAFSPRPCGGEGLEVRG
jgi:nicotinate-nucleotide pyrophosphorylase (carboxylating)